MTIRAFDWASKNEFLNRGEELAALERWWQARDRRLLAMLGRRRVGKSWLFRAFAHGKPAIVLVAERGTPGDQLGKLAASLEPALGMRPAIADVPDLFRLLFRLGSDQKILVVIDEFQHLLPVGRTKGTAMLSAIQAAIEEEQDSSRSKFILCGSQIGQMEKLLREQSPLHGRLHRFPVDPLGPEGAADFIEAASAPEWVERYAVSGGMPFYLSDLGRGGSLARRLREQVLDRRGALFNEPPYVLQQELRQPGFYLSILERLARGPTRVDGIAAPLGETSQSLSEYLSTLVEMRIVSRELPVTAPAGAVGYRYRLTDGFFRFWFRFVRPYQDQLETGMSARDLWQAEVAPGLADHVAPAFERLCQRWVRSNLGLEASRVGSWWGPALHRLRKAGERESEEIDVVGTRRGRVTVVGECKWTARPLSVRILQELDDYKLPALMQSGAKLNRGGIATVLFSRSGFTKGLRDAATQRSDLRLVELAELVP
jgi:AAA+ ATPase superfamily predicted ATPase